ncbi:HtaA domain-containing protein [Leucobacter allii]|uniref:HtaA domain-containing protein n=1 Tax=Leucobacter allii TaxID=2932247 RepID=UPI001FD5799E|nr:HtaA domain-containing protein [Leucobacter allii]UOR00865.1 HtaA domain-containing protein [Leucobacter allii]
MSAQKGWRKLLATATAGLVVASGIALAPAAANAAPGTVADATLSWGVKSSFRNYIYNFAMFDGDSSLLGNTTQAAKTNGSDGVFNWSGGTGVGDTEGASADVSFGEGNGVHFQSHPMTVDGQQVYALDMTFTNPHVVVTSPTTGELRLDVEGYEFESMTSVGDPYAFDDVVMADLALAAPTNAGGTLTWTDAAATLTAEGSTAFGGFYPAGETLDPVTFSLPTTEAAPQFDPQLTVTPATGLDAAGATVTVTGTGYNPDQPIYVTYCEDVPLENVTFSFIGAGCTAGAKQVTKNPTTSTQVQFTAEGSFETTLDIAPRSEGQATAVYTIANHTAMNDRSQDAKFAVSFGEPEPVADPKITVSPASDLDPAVENTITVSGTGFVGDGAASGAYVLFGEKSVWSGGSALPTAGWIAQGWVRPTQITDGAFETTLTIPANTLSADAQYQVATSAAHALSATDRSLDAFAGVTVKAETPVDPEIPFVDVQPGDKFYTEIAWMYTEGLSTGTKVGSEVYYRPANSVTREAMAAFLYRLAGEPAFTAPTKSPFADLKPGDRFYKEITWLASEGITTGTKIPGTNKANFLPREQISRAAMAAFMYRFAGEPSYSAPATSAFSDVKPSSGFYKEISWMHSTGISTGSKVGGKVVYQPKDSVKRNAMAAFVFRFDTWQNAAA